jgi:hypothetical protein
MEREGEERKSVLKSSVFFIFLRIHEINVCVLRFFFFYSFPRLSPPLLEIFQVLCFLDHIEKRFRFLTLFGKTAEDFLPALFYSLRSKPLTNLAEGNIRLWDKGRALEATMVMGTTLVAGLQVKKVSKNKRKQSTQVNFHSRLFSPSPQADCK